jgi:hypothetical protein
MSGDAFAELGTTIDHDEDVRAEWRNARAL